jgi:exodeoxyribonuclease VII small subunit
MKMKKAEAQNQNFESSLAALEKIVRELERGELPLEKSLELFERGVRLSRECQERLQQAERRIEVLLQRGEGEERAGVFGALAGEEFDLTTGDAKDAEDDESVF